MQDGQVLTVNEQEILAEFVEMLPEYETYRSEVTQQASRILPAMEAAYEKAMAQPLLIERLSRIGRG